MNWRDFLVLGNRLALGTSEAEWRTAVSRAYYAVFHVTRNLFADLQFVVPRADRAHQYLVYRLSNCGEAVVEQAGRDLETLRRLRNRADYDEAPAFSKSQAIAAVQLAERIAKVLDTAWQDPARTRMRDAIFSMSVTSCTT
jgi:uncharacterized protein (UPF0332 family)